MSIAKTGEAEFLPFGVLGAGGNAGMLGRRYDRQCP
jgi:hypothetical protein